MGREVLNEAYGVSKGGWVVTGVRDGESGMGCPVEVWGGDGEMVWGEQCGDRWNGGG